MENLRLTDKYKVVSNNYLGEIDHRVLTMLYLPILGVHAYSLYEFFYRMLPEKLATPVMMFKDVSSILNLKPTDIELALDKLEATGLIRTYEKEDYIVFDIKKPLSPKSFIQSLLGLYLEKVLTKKNVEYLKSIFQIEGFSNVNLKETSKSFDQVFGNVVSVREKDTRKYPDEMKSSSYLEFSNKKFDYRLFLETANLNAHKVLKEEKDTIINLAFIYGMDPLYMSKAYNDSLNEFNVLDLNLLKDNVKKWSSFVNIKKDIETVPNKNYDDERFNYLNSLDQVSYFKEITPRELLMYHSSGRAAQADLNIVERLYTELHVPYEVINVMLMRVIALKDGRIPTFNYFEKMALDWKQKGIDNAKKALDYVDLVVEQKEKDKENKNVYYKPKKSKDELEDPGVSWFDDYLKSIEE